MLFPVFPLALKEFLYNFYKKVEIQPVLRYCWIMKRRKMQFCLVMLMVLISCDPAGGYAFINKYDFDIIVDVTFLYKNELHNRSIRLKQDIAFWPGARHKEYRTPIEFSIKDIEGNILAQYSKYDILRFLEINKNSRAFHLSEAGINPSY
jgi:hypothetical protein